MNFLTLLEKYRKEAYNERDKGDKFERLMQRFLLTAPQYTNQIKEVWMWNDFFGKNDFGGKDVGIDLVARTHSGDYWAIQCKCFQESSTIDKPAVDSFLSTSSRSFRDKESLENIKFSYRLWISTTNNWGNNADEAIKNQDIPVFKINLFDLIQAAVDWEKLEEGIIGKDAVLTKKTLKPHQTEALSKTEVYFGNEERGKLIMACGTGKTFTSLRIAESVAKGNGFVLFLVPSIALLGQTLREWSADAENPISAICICSDPKITKKNTTDDDGNISVTDLAFPASTDVKSILKQFNDIQARPKLGLTVVFSTYQSIDRVAEAQKEIMAKGGPAFDLIICDEAHRTTGVTLKGDDEAHFVKVHDNTFIQANKRLYMTATPRLYGGEVKAKAKNIEAVLCSMDDENLYGSEIHHIGFGKAVEQQLLTDYKVLILTISEDGIPASIQEVIKNSEGEITTDDATKLIGCINALSKQILGDGGSLVGSDPEPMKRAVAFCQSIKKSKQIATLFNQISSSYLQSLTPEKQAITVQVQAEHIDGTMDAAKRDEHLSWLKQDSEVERGARMLTNVRCLSEGVDVPSLDAVLFLSAKNSQVDVVQSVGRVMRLAPNKKYGYIIIPVVLPSLADAGQSMESNEAYKVVWTVLNALRAHDDRFEATVNKIELNKVRPGQILVGTPSYGENDGSGNAKEPASNYGSQLSIQFQAVQDKIYARLVEKVGDRGYWESWAKDVAAIAERQVARIKRLIKQDDSHKIAFDEFIDGLHKNINPSISHDEAIDMLSQHVITKPVFEALFEGYSFVKNNPISVAMQTMLDLLEGESVAEELATLDKFYQSVKMRAAGIDNAKGRQRIIIELYDKFFKTAFPKMVEKLGIVYTPVEVVDFIIHSVNDVLKAEFGRSISDENIHILDPFTGTGTFITRLLQSGLISPEALPRKYANEIHANEIVLLAYYIAAVNIENVYHDVLGHENYTSFEGICLTDTFQLSEFTKGKTGELFTKIFPQNSERVQRQIDAPLRVIMGNPPYSVGQNSANDNAQNQKYPKLDARIAKTYVAETKAINKNSLYDAYIKAFRWSTDQLDAAGGIICFVSNGSWLDSNSADGFRKTLEKEFSTIYIFNLRGNQRTSGELSRKEGGKIFGAGSRTPITITLLVKHPDNSNSKAKILYHDIGDYLSREQKLGIVGNMGTVLNTAMNWQTLEPNEHGDWIQHRNDTFGSFIPLEPVKKFDWKSTSIFLVLSRGIASSRDAWVFNFSKVKLDFNISITTTHYNEQLDKINQGIIDTPLINPLEGVWTRDWLNLVSKGIEIKKEEHLFRKALYRPFCKQNLYFADELNQERYLMPLLFPKVELPNLVICIASPGGNKEFGFLITDCIPDLHLTETSQCFPLYWYEEPTKANQVGEPLPLYGIPKETEYKRRDGITDYILEQARSRYGNDTNKEDVFYYVYGLLHSPTYKETFKDDLTKMLPRIPLVDASKDFWDFSKAGRKLADLHLNYETVPAHPDVIVQGEILGLYEVEKMRFPAKDQKHTINYNQYITLIDIPEKAYQYTVNGKSAIEWVMERYAITTHKDSGIRNDPNDWAKEVGNPRYILDLLLSVIHVSTQTVDIVAGLPALHFDMGSVEVELEEGI